MSDIVFNLNAQTSPTHSLNGQSFPFSNSRVTKINLNSLGFVDQEQDDITFTLLKADGSALPTNIVFNANDLTLEGYLSGSSE